jgi:hypothetical protein
MLPPPPVGARIPKLGRICFWLKNPQAVRMPSDHAPTPKRIFRLFRRRSDLEEMNIALNSYLTSRRTWSRPTINDPIHGVNAVMTRCYANTHIEWNWGARLRQLEEKDVSRTLLVDDCCFKQLSARAKEGQIGSCSSTAK